MGAYVQRDGKTYYKADDGKLYQNYSEAAKANSFAGGLKRFAGDIWNTVRDQAVVPALDFAMQQGAPAPESMFLRYLTGTNKPVTNLPPATKAGIQAELPYYKQDTESWRDPENFAVRSIPTGRGDVGPAYRPGGSRDVQLLLGQYNVDRGKVSDKYGFDNLTDATYGGTAAQNAILWAQKLGFIKPDSGFQINAPID